MRRKILVVDSLEDMLEREKTILNRASFEIFSAATGLEALSVHKENQVDLMIISLDLPDMSGDKLCASIRKDPSLKQVSIIMTCSNDPGCIVRTERCGANAYITKPFHAGALTEIVTKLLSIPQRHHYRVLISITIKGNSANKPFFCSSHDISATGMMIETDRHLAKGDLLSCSFFLPGFGKIIAEGEIVRTDNSAKTTRHGIRFRYIDPEYKKCIDSFISHRTEQKI